RRGLPRSAARAVDRRPILPKPVTDFEEALLLAFIKGTAPARAPGQQQVAIATSGTDYQMQDLVERMRRTAGVAPGIGERDAGFPRTPVLEVSQLSFWRVEIPG